MRTTTNLERWFRCILAASAVFPMSVSAQAPQPAVRAVVRAGMLSFVGHATVGDFVGSTSTVSGAVEGDFPNARGWVEATVATLDTRNRLRDRDLRASMEVDTYPRMRFDLDGATVVSSLKDRGDTLAVLLHGNLTIHGVTREVRLPATLSRTADTIHVTAVFPLDMTDYRIGGLTKMFGLLRMQPQIEVRVDLRFANSPSDNTKANK